MDFAVVPCLGLVLSAEFFVKGLQPGAKKSLCHKILPKPVVPSGIIGSCAAHGSKSSCAQHATKTVSFENVQLVMSTKLPFTLKIRANQLDFWVKPSKPSPEMRPPCRFQAFSLPHTSRLGGFRWVSDPVPKDPTRCTG